MTASTLTRTAACCLGVFCLLQVPANAAELELKSLNSLTDATNQKRKIGPFVSIAVGETLGHTGTTRVGDRNFSLDDADGSAMFSIEVGKSWKAKRIPLQFSLAAEATFTSTTLQGSVPTGSLNPDDLAAYQADMNSLIFSLNGTFALDLYRYRARIGKILGGFKPYVGGGLGGGQVWFRNATGKSADQLTGGTTEPNEQPPFSIDEFINAWNWRAGLEWSWEERYSVFAEYRKSYFGDLDNLRGYGNDGYLVGFRYRY
ncbi:outer membrane protein with beta-barrel domain [Prosthecobacter fusiformis]|uniref:Outer membrane protein with beta-barrel domain n=1 Tax=Prosthecobacter fusiformis TaxID=48464 RepID=A0A4R7SPB1_9BACT|nr:outer membrane beta-barrel protein [Prosthecobacter fusiformis]TDU80831.1 outer membrane protein with beta-barrel domain [Prosthecobacter fusiformis]